MSVIKRGNCSYCSEKNVDVKLPPYEVRFTSNHMICADCWKDYCDGPFYPEQEEEYDDGGY